MAVSCPVGMEIVKQAGRRSRRRIDRRRALNRRSVVIKALLIFKDSSLLAVGIDEVSDTSRFTPRGPEILE